MDDRLVVALVQRQPWLSRFGIHLVVSSLLSSLSAHFAKTLHYFSVPVLHIAPTVISLSPMLYPLILTVISTVTVTSTDTLSDPLPAIHYPYLSDSATSQIPLALSS